jgi:hypothetical protein
LRSPIEYYRSEHIGWLACGRAGEAICSAVRQRWMNTGAESAIDCAARRQHYFRKPLWIPILACNLRRNHDFVELPGFQDVFAWLNTYPDGVVKMV